VIEGITIWLCAKMDLWNCLLKIRVVAKYKNGFVPMYAYNSVSMLGGRQMGVKGIVPTQESFIKCCGHPMIKEKHLIDVVFIG
jgi:hypothetical protein